MMGTLIFMTFIGVLIFALLQQLVFLQRWKQIQHECRQNTHKTQSILRDGFNELTFLNPQAETLRLEERLAKIEVKVAVDPWSKSAAKAHLLAVQTRQLLLRKQQQFIITKAKLKAQKTIREFKHQDRFLSLVPFMLKAHPPTSNSPSYLTANHFSHLQKIEVSWTYLFQNKKLKGKCGATVLKKDRFEVQILYPEASLLKASFF